jgi:hypothetical protein
MFLCVLAFGDVCAKVLDVGCGNGKYLSKVLPAKITSKISHVKISNVEAEETTVIDNENVQTMIDVTHLNRRRLHSMEAQASCEMNREDDQHTSFLSSLKTSSPSRLSKNLSSTSFVMGTDSSISFMKICQIKGKFAFFIDELLYVRMSRHVYDCFLSL